MNVSYNHERLILTIFLLFKCCKFFNLSRELFELDTKASFFFHPIVKDNVKLVIRQHQAQERQQVRPRHRPRVPRRSLRSTTWLRLRNVWDRPARRDSPGELPHWYRWVRDSPVERRLQQLRRRIATAELTDLETPATRACFWHHHIPRLVMPPGRIIYLQAGADLHYFIYR